MPEVGQWIVANPPTAPGPVPGVAACMSDQVEVRQITGVRKEPVHGMSLTACVFLDPQSWLVMEVGPPEPARAVLPHLTARPL
jgi:hypothetical protein